MGVGTREKAIKVEDDSDDDGRDVIMDEGDEDEEEEEIDDDDDDVDGDGDGDDTVEQQLRRGTFDIGSIDYRGQ